MPEPSESRVGVYIDFDNVVISRYDQLWGRGDFMRDRARHADTDAVRARLEQAKVDIGAILDYCSSFGTIAVSRAYADWSAPANASYQRQLINRRKSIRLLKAKWRSIGCRCWLWERHWPPSASGSACDSTIAARDGPNERRSWSP